MTATTPLPEDADGNLSIMDRIKKMIEETRRELEKLGGKAAFKSGEWLFSLVQHSFKTYMTNANAEYFQKKYNTTDEDKIGKKLISVAARNASVLGAVTGASVSTDELVAIITGFEGGVGAPANIAIAVSAITVESVLLLKFQLQLVANLAKAYQVPLDPDDPEDILVILAYAFGGSVAEMAGGAGMKVGGSVARGAAKKTFSKELLTTIKGIFAKIGVKLLQRDILKYAVPLASMGIGGTWNYLSTKAVGKIAIQHFKARRK